MTQTRTRHKTHEGSINTAGYVIHTVVLDKDDKYSAWRGYMLAT